MLQLRGSLSSPKPTKQKIQPKLQRSTPTCQLGPTTPHLAGQEQSGYGRRRAFSHRLDKASAGRAAPGADTSGPCFCREHRSGERGLVSLIIFVTNTLPEDTENTLCVAGV